MITDIFIRSYASDLPWVPYALRSLQKFVTGIRDIIISVPEEDLRGFKDLHLVKEILVPSRVPGSVMSGYLGQQCDKLRAHLYTDADTILFWDSDVLAVRRFSPDDLLINGKPRWLITPYAKLIKSDGSPDVPWQPITEKAIGRPVEFEAMRCHPLMVPRTALIEFGIFMEQLHGMTLEQYIADQPNREFSEWNCIGMWAYYYAPEFFSFWNTEVRGVPAPLVRQWWSWGGITPEIRSDIEKIIA